MWAESFAMSRTVVWPLLLVGVFLPSDHAHSGQGTLARSGGRIPSNSIVADPTREAGQPAHVLALRGGKGYGEGMGAGPTLLAPGIAGQHQGGRLRPKLTGQEKVGKQAWGLGKDSHSPSGMSPQQLGGSCELDCAAADVSSISASSECHSFGSGGVSKLKFEDDEPAVTEPVTKPSQPATKLKNGDMLDRNTRVIGVLGSGAFGTVYSSLDVAENKCVAVKVQRAGSKYTQVSLDEIHLLEEVGRARESAIAQHGHACGGDNVVELKAKFELGRPARQMCMSFEMLGPSILDLIIDHGYKGLPLPIVRQIARDCLNGLDFLHACDIVHTDVKPENVLLTLPEGGEEPSPHDGVPLWWSKNSVPSEGGWKLRSGWSDKLSERHVGAKLVDLGNSCFDNHHFTDNIQTIEYRSPEVVLGAGYSTSADVWSLACTIFELVTGEYLFDPHPGESYTREEDLLAHHQELLGAFPVEFALSGRQSPSFFDEQGNMWHVSDLRFWNLFDVLVDKYGWDRREAADFVDFLLPMLSPEPSQRATAADRLAHPWLAA